MIDADKLAFPAHSPAIVQHSPIPGELRSIPARPALGKGGTLMLEVVWNGSSWILTDFAEGRWFVVLMMVYPNTPRLNAIRAAFYSAAGLPIPLAVGNGEWEADIKAFLESVAADWLSQERRACSLCGKPYLGHDHAPCVSRLNIEYRNLFGGIDVET